MKNLLLAAEQIESKRFFFRCEFFIGIWFLNKNWTQKLSFWKKFFLQNMNIWKLFYYKICRNENFSNHNLKFWKKCHFKISFCRKKLASYSDSFFPRISFQTLNFNGKACFKIMLFKISTKSEKLVVGRGANRVKTFFFQMWIFLSESDFSIKTELKNWVSGKYSFSRIWIFEKFFIIKSAGTKISQFTIWNFEKMSFQNLIL